MMNELGCDDDFQSLPVLKRNRTVFDYCESYGSLKATIMSSESVVSIV